MTQSFFVSINKPIDMQLDEPCVELGQKMEKPNQPIEIYRGGLKVEYKGVNVRGKGRIFVKWLPVPETWFEMLFCDECGLESPASIAPEEAVNLLLETGPNQTINWLEINGIPEHIVTGKTQLFPGKGKFRMMLNSIKDPDMLGGNITFPQHEEICDSVIFYLSNFKDYSDLKLVEKVWTLSMDAISFTRHPEDESNILVGRMEKSGGFIITHTCILERTAKSVFPLSTAVNYLNAIYFFTSFLSGTWCGPILARGICNKKTVWQNGVPERLTPWTYSHGCVKGWMEGIEDLFKNFMIEWEDGEKQEAMKSLVQWYVEANLNAGGTEGSIILVHSALELLANLNGYNERPAYCKIRRLIKNLKVRSELNGKQANLKQIYDNHKYKLMTKKKPDAWDGPSIFSEMRNAIVHAKDKPNFRPLLHEVPKESREEALDLGLLYLELCILKRLGHNGEYFNRINLKYEIVPWISME